MSRSYKKPIVKDKGVVTHKRYRRIIRRTQKCYIKNHLNAMIDDEDAVIPNKQSIVSDYDYSDYTIDFHHVKNNWWTTMLFSDEMKSKLSRK